MTPETPETPGTPGTPEQGYRAGARPPPAVIIRLEALEPNALRIVLGLLIGTFVVLTMGIVATALLPRDVRGLVRLVLIAVIFVGLIGGLLAMRPRMKKLHYLLELSDAGSPDMRLVSPSGAVLATTANASLRVERVNYTRAGRHGRGWLRPGYRLAYPGGTHLVGTLFPQLPWDGVPHDPSRPDFELSIPDHEAIASRLVTPPS